MRRLRQKGQKKRDQNDTLKAANKSLVGFIAESEVNKHFDETTGFKCPDCDFIGNIMLGLKVHMTRKLLKKCHK